MSEKAKKHDLVTRAYNDLRYYAQKLSKLHKAIEEDFEFTQGQQWDEQDVNMLRKAGVKALTINKIKPIIKLITGIERQSRSDFKAFPEGNEDSLTAEVVTRLLKNKSKTCRINDKLSTQFKNGCIGGACFIEPYLDYSFNLINGDIKFSSVSALNVFFDPDAKEYDLSDSKSMIKLTTDISKEDLIALFPDKKKLIDTIGTAKIDIDTLKVIDDTVESNKYPSLLDGDDYEFLKDDENAFDLLDYYYKAYEPRWFVVSQERGLIKQIDTKEQAIELAQQIPNAQIIEKDVPVIRLANICGQELLKDEIAWFYPAWKSYPLFPFFFEFIDEDLDVDIRIQGVVRAIKDMQVEFNKRRTQELRHLNSSANSGFEIEEGQLSEDEESKLKNYGSSPGVVIKRKAGSAPLQRITPMPLSQGHAQLAAESAEDLKQASGVNPDLLATDSNSQSGRAILLKQRQGLVMVQEALDNFQMTKRNVGLFIISQFKNIFSIETAMKVLGDSFINENFVVPVNAVLNRGLEKVQAGQEPTEFEQNILLKYSQQNPQEMILDESGQLATTIDIDGATQLINNVLNDAEVGIYDVSLGEGAYSETVKMSNFLDLKELATQGVPIPPDVLIQTSMLAEEDKKKIMQSMQQQMQAIQQQQQKPPGANSEMK